ncbi:hypothetical protein, partial [Plasmodium yoelii yoelii]
KRRQIGCEPHAAHHNGEYAERHEPDEERPAPRHGHRCGISRIDITE